MLSPPSQRFSISFCPHGSGPADFSPALLAVQAEPPHPLFRRVFYAMLALFALLLVWAAVGKLDIVAVAEGKLVPASYLQVVQPAEAGIVKEILVKDGEAVRAGQVLMRMDGAFSEADRKALENDFHTKRLALRRIDAELAEAPLKREKDDPVALFSQAHAQHGANVRAQQNALAQERWLLAKARHDLAAAQEVKTKLDRVLPHFHRQEQAFEQLAGEGFASRLMANDKARERIEKEQDRRAQESIIESARASIAQSEQRLAQIAADYSRNLQAEREAVATQYEKLRQELAKQERRRELLELRAPREGIVKDLATHTPGTVVSPGTVLMTLVPMDEILRAEVWVTNQDVGFVRPEQPVKVKLAAFPFQKYGVLAGTVSHVSPDAAESNGSSRAENAKDDGASALLYRTLVDLKTSYLESDGHRYPLTPGMQVSAEVHLGTRSVLEYLLSPVQKAFREAGRER
jgi:hemolysin D